MQDGHFILDLGFGSGHGKRDPPAEVGCWTFGTPRSAIPAVADAEHLLSFITHIYHTRRRRRSFFLSVLRAEVQPTSGPQR